MSFATIHFAYSLIIDKLCPTAHVMIRQRWVWVGLVTIILWLTLRKSLVQPDIWSSLQLDLTPHQYAFQDLTLVNTTSLFAQSVKDPLLKALLLSAFGKSVYGTKVVPFYRKKTRIFDADTVTMITWTTGDRLGRIVSLAEKRQAPISLAYHISTNDKLATRDLILLDKLLASHPEIRANVDIHLVTSPNKIHLNIWRNVARTFASTNWILLWDADFEACTDYQKGFDDFRGNANPEWVEKLNNGKGALIIPAFEWSDQVIPRTKGLCPAGKEELAQLYTDFTIDAFESFNPVLSHATDYPRFMQAGKGEYYAVENYEMGYENYAIFRKDVEIWFDERFIDPGFERSAIIAHQYLTGVDFYVLPDQWAVHQEHPFIMNALMQDEHASLVSWRTFRMDLCHSLATRLAHQGLLHLAEGERIRTHCLHQEISDISSDLSRLISLSEETADKYL